MPATPDPDPTGPQLNDAKLTDLDDEQLTALALAVGMELRTCEAMLASEEIEQEELRWVQSDAERVRDELMRRGLWTEEGLFAGMPASIRNVVAATKLRETVVAVLDEYIEESTHEGEPMSFDDFVLYFRNRPESDEG